MFISFNWLKKYIDLVDSVTPEEVAAKLKASTVEVEKIVRQGEGFEGVVVGEIKEIKNHPDADKLHIAQVDVGEKKLRQVIFGEMVKMDVGLKVPVALAPTTLSDGKKIEKVKMRGELTEGMLCLDQELGLLKEGVSIQYFDEKVKNGTPITEVLGLNDTIFEIDNKSLSHRPDLWGHYGIAREVGVLFKKDLKEYKTVDIKSGKEIKLKVNIEDTSACRRYMGVAISGITVGPSPVWMQTLLLAAGQRPINSIVDITNYVMLDIGQPMHAFDKSKILNPKSKININVRRAEEGEKFTTLDGAEHNLTSDMLLIADEEKALALAGIMGGENSEISNDTTSIIFESANFDAACIRKTSTKLGLRTDSSMRFEKGQDPHNAELAMRRAVELLLEMCPEAKVASAIVDEKNSISRDGLIEISFDFINKKLGAEIPRKEVVSILQRLGFVVEEKKDSMKIKVPSWRATKDISIPEDIVEEVGRIYGFGAIESHLPVFSITPPEKNELRALERDIKLMASFEHQYTETYNYSFVSPHTLKQLGLDADEHIELDNPIAKDRPYLRRSLIPNLLENIEKNIHVFDIVRLFEVGKVFWKEEAGEREWKGSDRLLPKQDSMWGLAYAAKGDDKPFFELSHVVADTLKKFGLVCTFESVKEHAAPWFHPTRVAHVHVGDVRVGYIAELHPAKQEQFGILPRVALAEIDLNTLLPLISFKSAYKRLSGYPGVTRDIAFVVDKNVQHVDLVKEIQAVDSLIIHVELFDVYEGKNLPENKKSLAYRLTYASSERTLLAEEVDSVHGKVGDVLKEKFNAEVRK